MGWVGGVDRIWQAVINSWNGLVAVTRSEAAFRQELFLLALAIPLAFVLTEDVGRRFMLIGVIVFSIGTWIRVRSEEKLLREAFGPAFDDYARRVPAVVPFLF